MEASEKEKQDYIKENLIDKGYDSFLFNQFLCKKSGIEEFDLNKFTMGEIREGIQQFMNSTPLGNSVKSIDSSAPPLIQSQEPKKKKKNLFESFLGLKSKKKKEVEPKNQNSNPNSQEIFQKPELKIEEKNYDYGFHLPEKLKCQSIGETEISRYEDLPIKISLPEKIGKSIRKKATIYFTTIAVPLNKVVKRSFDDFEWLRVKLTKMFDSNFIPSLPKMNPILGIDNEEQTTRSIEKFMHYLSLDPIIKNSEILYDFLSIENYEQFIKKKKDYEIITPCNDIQEFKSITGEIDINFDDEKENRIKTIKEFCNNNSKLLDKLNSNLNHLYQEMNAVIKRTTEISNIWGNLFKTSEKYKDDAISKEIYFQMNNFFFNLAENFKKQNEFINIDIKESFIFMQHNYVSINDLIKRIEAKKKQYFKEEKVLISLKEDLFKTRNTPEHKLKNADIDVDKKNDLGEFDLSTLLPLNTQALLEMKKSYGFYLNRFLKEYDRMKNLNSVIYRDKIQKCYKTQNFIASELCACVEALMSSMDMYSTETKGSDFEKPKEEKKDNIIINDKKKENKNENNFNKNEIIENDIKQNEIKENENKNNEENNIDPKINNDKNNINEGNNIIEENDSGFNILRDNKEQK